MAHYTGPSCRICRREGGKLFLKGDRCFTEKCSFERRPYPPGQHGQGKIKFSEYGIQQREKQKTRRIYGVQEGQFRGIFKKVEKKKVASLVSILERRLDNVCYRAGFARSRAEARQLINHQNFNVNGKRVTIPSHLVFQGDVITVQEKSRTVDQIVEAFQGVRGKEVPQWLEVNRDEWKVQVKDLPTQEDMSIPIEERLIVEFYSK